MAWYEIWEHKPPAPLLLLPPGCTMEAITGTTADVVRLRAVLEEVEGMTGDPAIINIIREALAS